ncbi:MAG TPA: glycosyltransferase [Solirubrobacteraceae bacterium]|nr:glycosyltransferase [Solirubrobacteraceae bacterium]
MRVLLTIASMQSGGAERVVTTLAAGMAERGVDVALAAPLGPGDQELRGVRHERFALEFHERALVGAARVTLTLAGAVARFRPDVVHAHNVRYAALARAGASLAAPRGRPRVLATFHGVLPAEYRRAARILRTCDHVTCVSEELRARILAAGLPAARASVIRNAVALAAPLDPQRRDQLDREFASAGAPVIAIVGRLVAQEAHERFLVAARRVAGELPAAKFLIVGEGPRMGEIEALVAAAGLSGRARLTGQRADAREIIARADVLVFSSEWEGLSVAALEALAAGTPVLSTDVQGMRELLAGGAGAVVPLDDGHALGERLLTMLLDEDERAAMGRRGRELIAREYSLERMLDAYAQRYEQLAGAGS